MTQGSRSARALSSDRRFDLEPESAVARIEDQGTSKRFDLALEAARTARAAALRAMTDQESLMDRLFPKDSVSMKGSARALIVGSTKAIRVLVATAEEVEAEALGMRRTMARDHCAALEENQVDAAGAVRDLRAASDREAHATRSTLCKELASAEALCQETYNSMREAHERESSASARLSGRVAAQAASHAAVERELRETRDAEVSALREQLEQARAQLRLAQRTGHEAEEAAQASQHMLQLELDRVNHERLQVAGYLQDQTARNDSLANQLEALRRSHETAMVYAAALQERVQRTEDYTSHTQALLSQRVAQMHQLQAWALASSSAKALERRGVRELAAEERRARREFEVAASAHTLSWARSASPLAATVGDSMGDLRSPSPSAAHLAAHSQSAGHLAVHSAGCSQSAGRTPRPSRSAAHLTARLPSARSASRMRGLLYADLDRARRDALGSHGCGALSSHGCDALGSYRCDAPSSHGCDALSSHGCDALSSHGCDTLAGGHGGRRAISHGDERSDYSAADGVLEHAMPSSATHSQHGSWRRPRQMRPSHARMQWPPRSSIGEPWRVWLAPLLAVQAMREFERPGQSQVSTACTIKHVHSRRAGEAVPHRRHTSPHTRCDGTHARDRTFSLCRACCQWLDLGIEVKKSVTNVRLRCGPMGDGPRESWPFEIPFGFAKAHA